MLGRRTSLSNIDLEHKSQLISDYITNLELFRKAKSIALYSPIRNEVNTKGLFLAAALAGKDVYFPRVDGSFLTFHRVKNIDELTTGKLGVPAPGASLYRIEPQNIDLFIIPGLAFDRTGGRLGYGKGFYDRTLDGVPQDKRIGISYSFQLFNKIPMGEHDRRVGLVVTELGTIFCRQNQGGN